MSSSVVGRLVASPASVALAVGLAVAAGVCVAIAGPVVAIAMVGLPVFAGMFVALISRAAVEPAALVTPGLGLALVISQVPVLFNMWPPVRLACALVLVLLAAIACLQPRTVDVSMPRIAVLLTFLACLLVALFRGAASGANGNFGAALIVGGQVVAMAALAFGAIRSARSQEELAKRYVVLALAPAILVAANLIALVASRWLPLPTPDQISVALEMKSTMLGSLGISADRVQLPLSQSINAVGVVAAAGVASGLVLAFRSGRRQLGLISAAISLIGVLLADTRTALLLAVVVAALVVWRPKGRWAIPVAVALPLSPFIVMWTLRTLSERGLGAGLSRNAGDFATGSNRTLIWERAMEVASNPSSPDWLDRAVRTLFGYGAGGHISSGAAYQYEFLFRASEYRLAHTHNIAIQTFLDSGLIGIALLVAFALAGLVGLSVQVIRWAAAAPLLAVFVVILGAGLTEVVPTYMSPEALALACMIAAASSIRIPTMARETSGPSHTAPRSNVAPARSAV